MTTTAHVPATTGSKRAPMDSLRRTALVVGVLFSATDHHLRATVTFSASCLLGAALRAVLPKERAGGLVVRRRWVDVLTLVALGVAVALIGRSMNLHPHV